MGWSFRRRIKVIPGVHLNFSTAGISTSIGVRGASLTVGKKGTYLNAGIPGTGISYRQKLGGNKQPGKQELPLNNLDYLPTEQLAVGEEDEKGNVYSADIEDITSQDLEGIRQSILSARTQRKELDADRKTIRSQLNINQAKKILSNILLYGFFFKKHSISLQDNIKRQKEALTEIETQKNVSWVNLTAEFDQDYLHFHSSLVEAFKELRKSEKIWDITSEVSVDRYTTRSAASQTVDRVPILVDIKGFPELVSDLEVLYIQNANGADLYIYPSFVLMLSKSNEIALVPLEEIEFLHYSQKYLETKKIYSDSTISGYTWHKVNKNGERDKRFKDNFQIPLVLYGDLHIGSQSGINEKISSSNHRSMEYFYKTIVVYQEFLKKVKKN